MQFKRLSWVVFALLLLSGCGGSGDEPQAIVVPPTPPHEAATTTLSAANVPFLMANAQAIQHVLRWWAEQVLAETARVSPTNPRGGYFCSDGRVDVLYKDLDTSKQTSVNDQIVISSPACELTPLGGGATTVTVLATRASAITDSLVVAQSTVDRWTLGAYAWSHRLAGTFRFTVIDAERTFIRSEGPVRLTLPGGQVLELRNLAITYWPLEFATSGQFDLLFESGREAGTLIQVDSIGRLSAGGANVGPSPGLLQVSGMNGSKAKLQGKLLIEVGSRFLTSLDSQGTGQFMELSDLSDPEFYANFRQ